MLSDIPPTTTGQIYDEIQCGLPDFWATQCCLFDPTIYIRFRRGCHSIARSQKNIVFKAGAQLGIKLLHYRYLGKEYSENRTKRNLSRFHLGVASPKFDLNPRRQLPDRTRGRIDQWIEKNKLKVFNVVDK